MNAEHAHRRGAGGADDVGHAQYAVPADLIQRGLQFVADSFAHTFTVGFVLVLCTFIPIAFLPRRKEAAPTGGAGEGAEAPVMIH